MTFERGRWCPSEGSPFRLETGGRRKRLIRLCRFGLGTADALGATPTFGLFALINVGSWFFVKKYAPETRGRSLEELEDDFRTHDPEHFVHEAPAGVRGG